MQSPMENGIKTIIYNVKGNDGEQCIFERCTFGGPDGVGFVVHVFGETVYEWHGCDFVECNVEDIDGFQIVEMLSSNGNGLHFQSTCNE